MMAIGSAGSGFSSAFTGLQNAQNAMAKAAGEIADPAHLTPAGGAVPLENSMIDLQQASTQSLALLKLIKTQDDILGRFIDTWA